jgi:hypothetical protein
MRVRLKGINSYKAKLADGTTQTYWYAWKGGPRLQGEPGSPEFVASYNEAVAQRIKPPSGSLFALLQAYRGSEDFRQLAPRTQDDYKRIIQKEIESEFADFPLSGLTDRRTRGIFMEWRDKLAIKSRRQADYAWTVLARVLSWSKDRGKITVNPCERGGRIYRGSRVPENGTSPFAPPIVACPLDRPASGRSASTALVCLQRIGSQIAAVKDRKQGGHSGGCTS